MLDSDLAFSNRFLDRVKAIIGPQILVKTSFEVDTTQAADLTTLGDRQVRVSVRIRRPGYYKAPYWNQITLRDSTGSNSLSEVDKIVSGMGDLLFYGFARDEQSDELSRWYLINLAALRLHYSKCLKDRSTSGTAYGYVSPPNGEEFVWFDVTRFPRGVILESRVSTYSLPLPKGRPFTFSLLPLVALRQRIYNRLRNILDFYQVRIDYEITVQELLARLGSRVPKDFKLSALGSESKLYNIVSFPSNNAPVFAVQERPWIDDVRGLGGIEDILSTEARVKFYEDLGLPVLEWGHALNKRDIGESVVEAFLVNRINQSTNTKFKIDVPEYYPVQPMTITNPLGHTRDVFDIGVDWPSLEASLEGCGVTDVDLLAKPVKDIDGATVAVCVIRLSNDESVFGVGRCQEFNFPPTTPAEVAVHLATYNAGDRAYAVWEDESGTDRPEAIEAWRDKLQRLSSGG